jgi:hypothetical protein
MRITVYLQRDAWVRGRWFTFHFRLVVNQFPEAEEFEAILATQDSIAADEELDFEERLRDDNINTQWRRNSKRVFFLGGGDFHKFSGRS